MIILGIDPGTGRTGWGVINQLKKSSTHTLDRKITKSPTSKDKKNKVTSTFEIQSIVLPKITYIAHGCIVTEKTSSMSERLLLLHRSLNSLIEKHSPDCIIIENIFFGRNVKTAISVSQARGVIMLSAAIFNLQIFEYTPSTVKLMLTGSGKADKKGVQQTVRRILNTNSRKLAFNGKKDKDFDDSADALAIAIHHALKSA
jgi:crossover junction endodeoxyribonuclease RuvC